MTAARVLSRGPLNSCKLGPRKETPTLALPFPLTQTPTLWLGFCPACSPAHTHSVLRPSRPRNMPLRMDSSWLAVRCSSLTEAAPSKAPSSISDTLLLLRLLGEDYGVQDPFPAPSSHAREPCPRQELPHTQNFPFPS